MMPNHVFTKSKFVEATGRGIRQYLLFWGGSVNRGLEQTNDGALPTTIHRWALVKQSKG